MPRGSRTITAFWAKQLSTTEAIASPTSRCRVMALFGFSSGLPFLLVAGPLAYWLKDDGIKPAGVNTMADRLVRNANLRTCRQLKSMPTCTRTWR